MAKKKEKKEEAGSPAWMTTFADMMTLLLCFFVILFSMSQIEKIRFAGLASSLNAAFKGVPNQPRSRKTPIPREKKMGSILPMAGVPGKRKPTPSVGRDRGSQGVGGRGVQAGDPSATRKLVKAAGLEEFAGLIHLEEDENYLKVRLPGDITFKAGKAELVDAEAGRDMHDLMERIAMVLRWVPNKVIVMGHTDDTPTRSKRYPSNWELSSARAASIVRYLGKKFHLNEERFTVVGKGSTSPLVIAISPKARAKNRRVELWIRKSSEGEDPLKLE